MFYKKGLVIGLGFNEDKTNIIYCRTAHILGILTMASHFFSIYFINNFLSSVQLKKTVVSVF